MAEKSNIQWTDATWNVARGCTKVDEDCKFCYMMRDGEKFGYDGKILKKTKTVFNLPLKYSKTKSDVWHGRPLLFTSSLTDFFHKDIDSFRDEAWDIIRKCPHLIFQILTKRPERAIDHLPKDWGNGWDNVWMGTSIGSQKSIHRVKDLMKVKSKIRFLSIEPLYGEVDITNKGTNDAYNFPTRYDSNGRGIEWADVGDKFIGIDWVIAGGESGNDTGKYRYRPCKLEWIEKIVKDCQENSTPIFIKQLGTHLSKEMKLSDRHGGNIEEFPKHIRIREFPI